MGIEYEKKHVLRDVPVRATCDKCGDDIPFLPVINSSNPDGGLEVVITGWYGGFIDSVDWDRFPLTKLLCRGCAAKLCQEWYPEIMAEREEA